MDLFQTLIGPLLVAATFRRSYEITMGGSMVAMSAAIPFIISQIFASSFVVYTTQLSETMQRSIVVFITYLSSLPYLSRGIIEWEDMQREGQLKKKGVEDDVIEDRVALERAESSEEVSVVSAVGRVSVNLRDANRKTQKLSDSVFTYNKLGASINSTYSI